MQSKGICGEFDSIGASRQSRADRKRDLKRNHEQALLEVTCKWENMDVKEICLSRQVRELHKISR